MISDLRLDGDVERGGRLVGDQHFRIAGERHGDHGALAHAAGAGADIPSPLLGLRNAPGAASRAKKRAARLNLVQQQRLGDLLR
jgi:hypothetical protein